MRLGLSGLRMQSKGPKMKTVRFGIIGCGLMGREFASAAARWFHLPAMEVKPEIVALCDLFRSPEDDNAAWFKRAHSNIRMITADYRRLVANPEVEAVYCAVPHHLHREIYCSVIEAGKHLLGEKPFGIDKAANDAILECLARHPASFVRCSSEFPFFPAVQRIGKMIEADSFGRILELNAGFLHSSDLDPGKPINWKRKKELNGEYGCMGDLGMHVCHLPFRAGWMPRNVRAILSDVVRERPDGHGGMTPCTTWDNATLLCEALDPRSGLTFPWTLKMQRIAPGHKNTWYLEIIGTKACARFSTRSPKLLQILEYQGSEQVWQQVEMGHETVFRSVTGGIFEFGFSDAILQMWAAYLYELAEGRPLSIYAGCATPEETALSHTLFTAALRSQQDGRTVWIEKDRAEEGT
jgi:predicted dehydrogenase